MIIAYLQHQLHTKAGVNNINSLPDVGPECEHDEEGSHEEVAHAGERVDAEDPKDAGEQVEEHQSRE